MRNQLFKSVLFFSSILFAITSCQKDQTPDQAISADDQINILVDQSWNQMASEDLFPENTSLGIEMRNEGISADFLLDASYLEDSPPANCENPANWYSTRDHSLIQCLRGLSLSTEQKEAIRVDLRTFQSCKSDAIQRARAIYRELRAEYHHKFQRLVNAYHNGTLTQQEFKQKVHELRIDFRHELQRLHLHERLDQALKQCLHTFMRELHGVLNGEQWNSFVECYVV
ncbi:MAG: hypothetical protein IH596_03765 [Bacteroidales bacterium]|nr:hypothetical protein [Bacteroidales bacterium]